MVLLELVFDFYNLCISTFQDMARKLKREVDLLTTRQLAMDRELHKLSKYNKDTIVDIAAEVSYVYFYNDGNPNPKPD